MLTEKRALEYTAFEKGFKRYLENKDYIEYDNLAQKTTKTFQEISRSIREIEAVAKSKGQKTVSPPAATPTTAPATTETEIKYSKEANDSSVDEKSGDQRSTNTNTNTTNEAQTDTKTDERTPHKDAAPDSEFHAFAEQIREIQLIEKDKLTLTVIMHMSQKAYVVDKNVSFFVCACQRLCKLARHTFTFADDIGVMRRFFFVSTHIHLYFT